MADAPTDAPATGTPVTTPPTEPTTPPATGDEPLGETGKRALDSERKRAKDLEARVKELEPLAQAAREREDAEKSELTKLNEALSGERDARTKAERELLRYTVAAAKGVPANLAKLLTGTNKEEVEQAADDLLDALGTNKPTMPGRPTGAALANGKPSQSNLDTKDPMTLIAMGRGQTPPKQ